MHKKNKKKMRCNQKLYVIVRRDLLPGAQACQGLHAFREFVEKFPLVEAVWYRESNYLCMLSVPDEIALLLLIQEAEEKGVRWAAFKEPDFDNQYTAVALEPTDEAMQICACLPLALREFGAPNVAIEQENKL